MLQINQTTVRITASETVNGVNYSIQYDVVDGKLTVAICRVSKVEENGHPGLVGTITLQEGKIRTDLKEGSDIPSYIEAFEGYLSEIREGLEKEGQ